MSASLAAQAWHHLSPRQQFRRWWQARLPLTDTWQWTGTGWLQETPAASPKGGEIDAIVTPIRRLDSIPTPSATMTLFEGSDLGARLGDERTHPDTWFRGWSNVVADIDPWRHGAAANYLFADGHVETIPAIRLKKRLEQGDHFAVPR